MAANTTVLTRGEDLARIKREKGRAYMWPGDLPDDRQHYLPYQTVVSDKLCDLKPGTKITINKTLYDAEKTFRPGRFQCVEATAHTDKGDKKGFVWTVHEGKVFITPAIKKKNKHTFKIIKKVSKLVKPAFKIKVRNLDKDMFNKADFEPLKRGTMLYVTDDTRPSVEVKDGEWVGCKQFPKDTLKQWCWQFKIGKNGKLEKVKAGKKQYNNLFCSDCMWTSTYNVYIKDYLDMVLNWKDPVKEKELTRKTLVKPDDWKAEIKDKPEDCFQGVEIKGENDVYLTPKMPKEIWNIKLVGYENWMPDIILKDKPNENLINYIKLNFDIEIDAYLDDHPDPKISSYCKYAIIKKFKIDSENKLNKNYYKSKKTPFMKYNMDYEGLIKKFMDGNNFFLDDYKCKYQETGSKEISQPTPYFRPNSNSYFYNINLKSDKTMKYDFYWLAIGSNLASQRISNVTPVINYNCFKLRWGEILSYMDNIRFKVMFNTNRECDRLDMDSGVTYKDTIKNKRHEDSLFLEQATHILPVNSDGSEIHLRFDKMHNFSGYYTEDMIKKHKSNKMKWDVFIERSYEYKIKRTYKK